MLHNMHRKIRQTLTISPEVSRRAKMYARRRGISLSALVEQLLTKETEVGGPTNSKSGPPRSFSRGWAGQGALARRGDDVRARCLREKYGL